MSKWITAALMLLALSVSACGNADVDSEPDPSTAATTAKGLLEEVAETGELGSGAMSIREQLESLKESDPAKADELLADLDDLERTNQKSALQSKAKAMAEKL